jgi:hypothetical protein
MNLSRHFAYTFFAMFPLCKAVLPQMKGGSIINTTRLRYNLSIRAQPHRLCVIQSGYCQLRSLPRKSGHQKRCARQRGSPGSRPDAVNHSTIPKEKSRSPGRIPFWTRRTTGRVRSIFVFLASDQAS